MFRRLAILGLAVVPLVTSCGQRQILTVGVQHVTVSPNADALSSEADIPYDIGTPAHVTITLVQPDGARTVLRDNDRDAESFALPFSGVVDVPNSSDKRVLPNGTYKVVFDATTPGGGKAEQTVNATVTNADPVPLTISNIALSLPTFAPNGQGIRTAPDGTPQNLDQTTINYSLSKDAEVSMNVVDKSGAVTPIMPPTELKQGDQTFTWTGKGASGVPLPSGQYTWHIQAQDTSGNVTDRTTTVTITDSGTPQVQILEAAFGPRALSINGIVNVEVTVKNIGDVPILTQGPPPGTIYKSSSSYTDPIFNKPGNTEPPYDDKPGRWRVGVRWTSSAGQYPIRWGFFADDSKALMPGDQVTVRGGIQMLAPQPPQVNFWATVEMGGIGFMGDYGQTQVTIGQ